MVARTDGFLAPSAEGFASQADQAYGALNRAGVGESGQAVSSILVADCGSSFTHVSLLERVEAGYSFVAHATSPTTAEPPWSDVSIGVRHAIEQIADVVRRPLLDQNGALIIPELGGRGVDLLVLTCSAGEPLRVVLAGLVSQVSLASLERAAASSYADVLGVISRDYIGPQREDHVGGAFPADGSARASAPQFELESGAGLPDEEKIALIRQYHPDVVWVAGGTDGGSREPVRDLVETVALACTLVDGAPQPTIVYAGNADLRSEIVALIGEEADLEIIDNVRPDLDIENLAMAQSIFQAEYVQRKVQHLPGIGNLIGWSAAPVLSSAQAMEYLVMYLAHLYESGKGVLCADVGGAATSVAAGFPARPGASRSGLRRSGDGGQHTLQVAPGLGVGHGAPELLERFGEEAIARWLPFEPEPGEIATVLLNKGVRPTTIPQDRRQLLIEQAAAREALRSVMKRARETWQAQGRHARRWLTPFMEPIIATGGVLARTPRPSQTVLMMLDAIEPAGVTTILLDEHGVASALGAIAVTQPLIAARALDAGAFLTLATVVAPIGRARPGEVIMRVKIDFERSGELEIEVKQGSLEVLPLRIGEKATMELKPRRGIHVGRIGKVVEVSGSAVGLVIDARGRPLRLPSGRDACRQLIQQWFLEMGA